MVRYRFWEVVLSIEIAPELPAQRTDLLREVVFRHRGVSITPRRRRLSTATHQGCRTRARKVSGIPPVRGFLGLIPHDRASERRDLEAIEPEHLLLYLVLTVFTQIHTKGRTRTR